MVLAPLIGLVGKRKTLTKKVEIERVAVIEQHPIEKYFWLDHEAKHEALLTYRDIDIANAAVDAGYKVGDEIKYKIIIECKE